MSIWMDPERADHWGIDWDGQPLKERVESASTGVQVVVSLDKLIRDFGSEKDEVESASVTADNHTDEGGKGQLSTIPNKRGGWRYHVRMSSEPGSFIYGTRNLASKVILR